MPRRKLRSCNKCGFRHGPPIGSRCERLKEELEKISDEMEEKTVESGESGSSAGAQTAPKTTQIPAPPTYQPLGDDQHVPLFQSEAKMEFKSGRLTKTRAAKKMPDLQAQPEWDEPRRPFTLPPQSGLTEPAGPGSERSRQQASAAMAAQGSMASPHQFDESTDYRLRSLELLVERMADVQRAQVLADYNRSQGEKLAKKKEESSESSSGSDSEFGVWTEGDGRDLWKATKEKKKRNPFDHSSYLRKGEVVDSYERLMVVTFKTMEELMSMGKDVKGLVRHG